MNARAHDLHKKKRILFALGPDDAGSSSRPNKIAMSRGAVCMNSERTLRVVLGLPKELYVC